MKFKAPDIKNNTLLKFNFTATDNKGVNQSDLVNVWINTTNIHTANQTSPAQATEGGKVIQGEPEGGTTVGGKATEGGKVIQGEPDGSTTVGGEGGSKQTEKETAPSGV